MFFSLLSRRAAHALIALYRCVLSPFLGGRCRFVPSCSAYAHEAVEKHGAVKGMHMACCRLMRCHPFSGEGFRHDPVKEMKS